MKAKAIKTIGKNILKIIGSYITYEIADKVVVLLIEQLERARSKIEKERKEKNGQGTIRRND